MPLSTRQDLMLHLAGTVRLPSPPPATGCVWTVAPAPGEVKHEDVVFRVAHRVSSRLWVERIVRMRDVRAILAPWPGPKKDDPHVHGYRTYEQFHVAATEYAAAHRDADTVWLINAVAFVDETAPVVLATEAALTAAESADYYPPIVGDGRTPSRGVKGQPGLIGSIDDCNEYWGDRS